MWGVCQRGLQSCQRMAAACLLDRRSQLMANDAHRLEKSGAKTFDASRINNFASY